MTGPGPVSLDSQIDCMDVEHNDLPRAMSLASHELRTPLSVVAGYLRMLLREQAGPVSEKQRKMLEEAERSCGRIATLVSEMSELGKLESGRIEVERRPFNLAALVADVASRMHEGSDRGVRLDVRGTDRPLPVVGDRSRLDTAITGLLHATLRERGEPGTIVVACCATEDAEPAAIIAMSDETTVGELAEAASWSPFDEWARGGMGLVLPLARRIVEAHGGSVWSGRGEGPRTGSAVRIPLSGVPA